MNPPNIPLQWLRWCATAWLVALLLSAAPGWAISASQMVVFGDSLSDTGNLFVAAGFPPAPYDNGRFSNGPVWVEELASRLALPAPTPSLLGGTNYAWGGAETGLGISSRGTPNLGTQIDTFLSAHTPSVDQLFVLWGGANDFNNAGAGGLPNPADLASAIAGHVSTLAGAAPGEALSFLVANLPPLGQTARAQWLGANVDPAIPFGLDLLSQGFNAALAAELDALEAGLGVNIYRLDIFALTQEMLANPAAFGFTNTTDTARLGTNAIGGPPDVESPNQGVVPNPNEYVFFDDVHPTATWHQAVGVRAARLLVPEPATLALYGLGTAVLLVLGIRRPGRRAAP